MNLPALSARALALVCSFVKSPLSHAHYPLSRDGKGLQQRPGESTCQWFVDSIAVLTNCRSSYTEKFPSSLYHENNCFTFSQEKKKFFLDTVR